MPNNENLPVENGLTETSKSTTSQPTPKVVRFSTDQLIPSADDLTPSSSTLDQAQVALDALPAIPIPKDENSSKFVKKHLPRASTPLPKEFGRMFNTWDDEDDDDDDDAQQFEALKQEVPKLGSSSTHTGRVDKSSSSVVGFDVSTEHTQSSITGATTTQPEIDA